MGGLTDQSTVPVCNLYLLQKLLERVRSEDLDARMPARVGVGGSGLRPLRKRGEGRGKSYDLGTWASSLCLRC